MKVQLGKTQSKQKRKSLKHASCSARYFISEHVDKKSSTRESTLSYLVEWWNSRADSVGEKGRGADKAGADKAILATERRGPFSVVPRKRMRLAREKGERREKAENAHAATRDADREKKIVSRDRGRGSHRADWLILSAPRLSIGLWPRPTLIAAVVHCTRASFVAKFARAQILSAECAFTFPSTTTRKSLVDEYLAKSTLASGY